MKIKFARGLSILGIVLAILALIGFLVCLFLAFALMKEELFLVMLLFAVLEVFAVLIAAPGLSAIQKEARVPNEIKAYRARYKTLLSGQFEKISIRGRVAYAICCLENAMETYGAQGESWDLLLKNLWSFTSSNELDKWFYLNNRFLPGEIIKADYSLAQAYNMRDGFPELSIDENTYKKAQVEFAAQSNDVINEICDKIFDLGAYELWSGLVECSWGTLYELQLLIDYMKANDIPLPDVEPFKQHEYAPKDVNDDDYGWGYTFDGHIHSKYLKECTKQEEN